MTARPYKGRLIVVRGTVVAGPYGDTEADQVVRRIRRRYTDVGLRPPPITTQLLHSREWMDSWVDEDVYRQCRKATGEEEQKR